MLGQRLAEVSIGIGPYLRIIIPIITIQIIHMSRDSHRLLLLQKHCVMAQHKLQTQSRVLVYLRIVMSLILMRYGMLRLDAHTIQLQMLGQRPSEVLIGLGTYLRIMIPVKGHTIPAIIIQVILMSKASHRPLLLQEHLVIAESILQTWSRVAL